MPVPASQPGLPPQLESACLQLDALAALLQCTDCESWESLARPGAGGLAALLFRIGAEMRSGAEDLLQHA